MASSSSTGKRQRVARGMAGIGRARDRPAHDPRRFSSAAAEDMFERVIHNRPFTYEHMIDFTGREQECAAILQYIEEQHWGFLFTTPVPTNQMIVREFYANWCTADLTEIFVRGRTIRVDVPSIRQALQIPPPPADDQPDDYLEMLDHGVDSLTHVLTRIARQGAVWEFDAQGQVTGLKSAWLNFEARVWMKIALSHFIPCGHVNLLTFPQIYILYCLVERRPIDIPRLVRRTMSGVFFLRSNQALPYPALVTQLAAMAQVPRIDDDPIVDPPAPILIRNLPAARSLRPPSHDSSSSGPNADVSAQIDSLRRELLTAIQASEERIVQRLLTELRVGRQGTATPAGPSRPVPPSGRRVPPARRHAPRDDPDSDEDDPDVEISEHEGSDEDY